MKITLVISILWISVSVNAQSIQVPAVHSNIFVDENGKLFLKQDTTIYPERNAAPDFTYQQALGNHTIKDQMIYFDFLAEKLTGSLVYGLVHYEDSKHPMPVYRTSATVKEGKATINIVTAFSGIYDMVGWQKSGKGTIGFRLINDRGRILYNGFIGFKGKESFERAATVIEGPFVNNVTESSAVISFRTDMPIDASVLINGKTISGKPASTNHEIVITDLQPKTEYRYSVQGMNNVQSYSFKTFPKKGSRQPFTFAYASDSRSGQGGGERDVLGANFYIMKKIASLAKQRNAAFMQFTGDLVGGYVNSTDFMRLQYANWKGAIEPFAHYYPWFIGMGNHEAVSRSFTDGKKTFSVDRFPYETESAEILFAENFVNPVSDLVSEDGASYDPDPNNINFPSYSENVFHYTYDNVAVITLNTNYFFAPTNLTHTGGGLHGYIMDNQVAWLKKTIDALERDNTIDHIFITGHTPFFPNGGHVGDDMWYRGNNKVRSQIGDKPLSKGILERRDEMLDYFMNNSKKVVAILTGDEHNYCLTKIDKSMEIYPKDWTGNRINLSRTIYQVNNGAAGAPYYGQEQTPWTLNASGFTTQHALVLFHVAGKKINVEVLNPDTLEEISKYSIR